MNTSIQPILKPVKKPTAVALSVTSLDPALARTLEPRASSPRSHLRAIREPTDAGIPAGVSIAPVIPGLNEHEIPPPRPRLLISESCIFSPPTR
ncbi:MAG: hypothetical protein P8J87_08430 [Verrucomicrobiales bacterium]|nr:hypothetical protein [Verrucomicrobiales bacterium]